MSDVPTMPETDPAEQQAGWPTGQPRVPLIRSGDDPVAFGALLSTPAETHDLEGMLAARPPRRKLPRMTVLLTSAALLGAGVIGGIEIQKHLGASAPSGIGALLSRLPAAAARTGSGAGTPGGPGSFGGGATVGTVVLVDGSTIYVQTTGGIVKVKTTPSTTVNVTQSGSIAQLKPGSAVVVTGAGGSDGTVTARSVSQGAGGLGAGNLGGGRRTGG